MNERRTREAYNRYAAKFAETRKGKVPWTEFDILSSYIQKERPYAVLDLGCGGGRMIPFLEEQLGEFSYLGVDYSAGLLEEARKVHGHKSYVNFSEEDMTQWKGKHETYDLILMIASFHHLLTSRVQKDLLGRLYDALKPQGLLYMTNWNLLASEKYKSMQEESTSLFHIPLSDGQGEPLLRTYYGFQMNELRELFLDTGFHILLHEEGRNIVSVLQK